LEAVLGARLGADVIRQGADAARVEALFELTPSGGAAIVDQLALAGLEVEPEEALIIRREISSNGRSRVFINDVLSTVGLLRSLQPHLAMVQSQGAQLSLLDPGMQLDFLDTFLQLEQLRTPLKGLYSAYLEASSSLRQFDIRTSESAKREDFIRFQLSELDRLNLQAKEEEELESELNVVRHSEKVKSLASEALEAIYESDLSALSILARGQRALDSLVSYDPRLASVVEVVATSREAISEAIQSLIGYADDLSDSPERLDFIESRLQEIEKLKRKHATDADGLLALREDLRQQISSVENREAEREVLVKEVEQAGRDYLAAAAALSEARRKGLRKFEKKLLDGMRDLALQKARFEVALTSPDSAELKSGSARLTATGYDEVRFLFSANPGEPLKPLDEVASGGELSRIYLALYSLRSTERREHTEGNSPLLVFDEIDAGIGGRVAEKVGRKLRDVSANRQVVCITHQPQIARFAEAHLVVEKEITQKRSSSLVRLLDPAERTAEMLRMLGGSDDKRNRELVDRMFQEDAPLTDELTMEP
jgi:DNA repair protein RecN (Recombination protein N)